MGMFPCQIERKRLFLITIIDVAKLANVSKSTVSRVLTNNGYVSDTSRIKVLNAMKRLGYTPNLLARSFRKSKTNLLGFIANSSIHLFGEFVERFIEIAEKYNYGVAIFCSQGNLEKEIEYLNMLKYKQIDGMFILTKANEWQRIKEFSAFGPIATWQRIDAKEIYSSYIDHYQIYSTLLDHLIGKGYDDFGILLSNKGSENTRYALKAVEDRKKKGKFWTYFCKEQEGSGEIAAENFLKLPHKPRTIVIYSDYVAGSFMRTVEKKDKELLHQLNIISLDNNMFSQLMGITSFDLDIPTQAHNAFAYIYNHLNKDQMIPLRETQVNLCVRKSFNDVEGAKLGEFPVYYDI